MLKPITPTRKQSVYLSPRIRELSPPAGEAARPIRARSRVLGGTAGKSTASVSEKVEKVRRKKAGRPRAHQALGAAGGELKFATGTRRSRRLACTHGNAGHRGPACFLVVRRKRTEPHAHATTQHSHRRLPQRSCPAVAIRRRRREGGRRGRPSSLPLLSAGRASESSWRCCKERHDRRATQRRRFFGALSSPAPPPGGRGPPRGLLWAPSRGVLAF